MKFSLLKMKRRTKRKIKRIDEISKSEESKIKEVEQKLMI